MALRLRFVQRDQDRRGIAQPAGFVIRQRQVPLQRRAELLGRAIERFLVFGDGFVKTTQTGERGSQVGVRRNVAPSSARLLRYASAAPARSPR